MRGIEFDVFDDVICPRGETTNESLDVLNPTYHDVSEWLGFANDEDYLRALEEQGPFIWDRVR